MTMLSIIIPLAANEMAWQNLLADLAKTLDGTEIIFVTSEQAKSAHETILLPNKKIRWLKAKAGRGSQMNAGAIASTGKFLWFLHADSVFGHDTLSALQVAINNHPKGLLYCNLAFLRGSSCPMFINAWGARLRSHLFKVPFGDQGFCIRRDIFKKLGGFDEDSAYGEDHLFVWKARFQGVKLHSVGATLYTSARKYQQRGWLKTTCLHQYLWLRQAWPQWKKLKRKQLS